MAVGASRLGGLGTNWPAGQLSAGALVCVAIAKSGRRPGCHARNGTPMANPVALGNPFYGRWSGRRFGAALDSDRGGEHFGCRIARPLSGSLDHLDAIHWLCAGRYGCRLLPTAHWRNPRPQGSSPPGERANRNRVAAQRAGIHCHDWLDPLGDSLAVFIRISTRSGCAALANFRRRAQGGELAAGFCYLGSRCGKDIFLTETIAFMLMGGLITGLLPAIGLRITGIAFLACYVGYLLLVYWLAKRRIGFKWPGSMMKLLAIIFAVYVVVAVVISLYWWGVVVAVGLTLVFGVYTLTRIKDVSNFGNPLTQKVDN